MSAFAFTSGAWTWTSGTLTAAWTSPLTSGAWTSIAPAALPWISPMAFPCISPTALPCISTSGAVIVPAMWPSAFHDARAAAAADMSGAAILIFVPTGTFHIAWRSAIGCGAPTVSLLVQLPVTCAPVIAVAFHVAGRTYHATFARGGAIAAWTFACHDASGSAIHTARDDAVYVSSGAVQNANFAFARTAAGSIAGGVTA